MNMMKRTIAFITMILLLASCQMDDFDGKVSRRAARPEAETFGCAMETPWTAATKSQYIAGGFDDEKITNITVAVYDHTSGDLYSKYNFTSGFSSMSITLIPGNAYDLYAVANMGDQRTEVPSTSGAMASFTYTIPSYSDVNTRGLPMSATITNYVAGTSTGNVFNLKRLFAKVTLNVTTSYDGGTSGGVKVMNLKVGNGNAKLTPFGYSALTQAADRLTTEDYQANNSVNASSVVFYVPENMKGNIGSASTSRGKNPDVTPAIAAVSDLLTYVDVAVMANSSYYNGSVHYRSYVGTNATNNFDVRGNYEYTWNMTLTEDGLVNDDWKIDQEMDDLRYISFNQNPVLVEKDEEVRWANLLVTNMAWGDISKNYTGTSIYSATPTSTGFTVKSSASAGNTMTATFTAAHNPKPSLTATTDFIVITRSIAFDDDVYAVNPRGSVGSEVIYSNSYQGRQKGKGSFSQGGGEEWVIVPPAALPHTTTASTNKLDYSYDPVTDIITWSPTRYALPGDYTIKARKTVGAAGEATATLRVNDTRWINADLAYDSRPRETSIGVASITASSVWNIGYAWGDLSVSDSDNQTVDSPNYGIFAGNDVTANWSDYIGYDFIDGSGQYLTLSGTPTANGMTFSISQNIPMGDYSVKVYWKDTWDDGLGDYRIKDVVTLHITGIPITSISISPGSQTIFVGNSFNLTANVYPYNASIKKVGWEITSGSGVVSVVSTDNTHASVTGLTGGTAKVRAVALDGSGVVSNECTVTVYNVPISITVSPSSTTIYQGEDVTYTIIATFGDGTTRNVTSDYRTGTSNNIVGAGVGGVSQINASGSVIINRENGVVVTGNAVGSLTLRFSYNYCYNYVSSLDTYQRQSVTAEVTVNVIARPSTPTSLELLDSSEQLYIADVTDPDPYGIRNTSHDISNLMFRINYSNGASITNKLKVFDATLSSSDATIIVPASNNKGLLAYKKGSATITVTIEGVSTSFTARVSEARVSDYMGSGHTHSFYTSSNQRLTYWLKGWNESAEHLEAVAWDSESPTVFSFDGDNAYGSDVFAYNHSVGSARCHAAYNGTYGVYTIDFVIHRSGGSGGTDTKSLAIVPSDVSLNVGNTVQLIAKLYDGSTVVDPVVTDAVWSIFIGDSYITLATNAEGAIATAIANGNAKVRARYTYNGNTYTAYATIRVSTAPPVYSYQFEVTPATASISVGATQQFTATFKVFQNGNLYSSTDVTSSCTWTMTAGGSYASVNNSGSKGLVTANAVGNATVQAAYTHTSGSYTGTAAITVVPAGSLIINFDD